MAVAIVLDRLTTIAYLDHAHGSRGAFEEMAQCRQLNQLLLGSTPLARTQHIQGIIHFVKCRLGLLKVVPYQAAAKFTIVFVHVEQLLKHININYILRE